MHIFISWLRILLCQFYSQPGSFQAVAEESYPFFHLSPMGRETSVSYGSSHGFRLILIGPT